MAVSTPKARYCNLQFFVDEQKAEYENYFVYGNFYELHPLMVGVWLVY